MGVRTRSGTAVQSAASCELRAGGDCVSVRRPLYCSVSTVSSCVCATIHSASTCAIRLNAVSRAGLASGWTWSGRGFSTCRCCSSSSSCSGSSSSSSSRISSSPLSVCAPSRPLSANRPTARLKLPPPTELACPALLSLSYFTSYFKFLVLSHSPLLTITVLYLVAQSLHLLADPISQTIYEYNTQYKYLLFPSFYSIVSLFVSFLVTLVSKLFFEYFLWFMIV